MRIEKRLLWCVALCVLGGLACGDSPVGNGGGPPPPPPRPFDIFEIFLRPLAIERPTPGARTPTPLLAYHHLTVFYRGGQGDATFEWRVPAGIGTVEPKSPTLTRSAAAVVLRLRDDQPLPLGFHDIQVVGRNLDERDSLRTRFAVMQNTWMKHRRTTFNIEPEDLILSPAILTVPGRTVAQDTILYAEAPSPATVKLRAIPAYKALDVAEAIPSDVMRTPRGAENNNYETAPKLGPDPAPAGLGRREILFSSQMDPRLAERCPRTQCSAPIPHNIWVVRTPSGQTTFEPKPVTHDSVIGEQAGITLFSSFNYTNPRWDPSATNPNARISFLSDRLGQRELWLGDLVDLNADSRSDTLMNLRRLTTGGLTSYDWHPDGTRICVARGRTLSWIDPATGAVTPIALGDSLLTRFGGVSVFWRPGEHTLVAFQAASENLVNLYVFDVEDRTLTRVLPFSFAVTHNLFPRWHPYRKQLYYVSDYTVEAWANSTGSDASPDRLNPNTAELFGQRRTFFPSIWALRFEEPSAVP